MTVSAKCDQVRFVVTSRLASKLHAMDFKEPQARSLREDSIHEALPCTPAGNAAFWDCGRWRSLPKPGPCDRLTSYGNQPKYILYHDDREAQLLLKRIKEKMVRMQPMRDKASELMQSSERNQEDKRCRN